MSAAAADIDASIVTLSARLSELVQLRSEILRHQLAAIERSAARSSAHRGLSIKEAAAESGMSRSTITRLIQEGELVTYGTRAKRILPEVLHAWMGRTKQQPPAGA